MSPRAIKHPQSKSRTGSIDDRGPRRSRTNSFRNKDQKKKLLEKALAEAQLQVNERRYVSRVVEIVEIHGEKVMWSDVPQALKDKYNCTDIMTLCRWLKEMGRDINEFKPGKALYMTIRSAKFNRRGQIKLIGMPLSDAEDTASTGSSSPDDFVKQRREFEERGDQWLDGFLEDMHNFDVSRSSGNVKWGDV